MGEVTPLFICGMGRSGTTSALRVLNSHPSVMLNGEISLSIQKQFFALLDGVERSYSEKDNSLEGWKRRKADYMFDSFGYLSKGGRGKQDKIPEARFRGHKTPRLETLFDTYEKHFGSIGLQPRYVYCARNPFDCWRSYKATSWSHNDLEKLMAQYTASFVQLRGMEERASDRISVIVLDALIAAPDAAAFYRDRLFAPLGLDVTRSVAARLEKIRQEQTSLQTPPALSPEEISAIASYPGIAEISEALFSASAPR